MRLLQRPLSLALRLTLLFTIAATIVLSVFGLVINKLMENHFFSQDTDELRVIVDAVQNALATANSDKHSATLEQRFDDILVGHHDASLFITTRDSGTLYISPEPDLSTIKIPHQSQLEADLERRWNYNGLPYTVLLRTFNEIGPDNRGPFRIVAAVPFDDHLHFLNTFRRNLWIMIAGSVIVMSIMGWVAVRRGHAPLHEIISRIRRISARDLNTHLPYEGVPYELVDLVTSFNEMLQRMDEAFQRLADFNADIAHELRTPITNLMTQTQVALSRARTINEYQDILYSNVEEYDRLAQMVNDMLFLAQTDNHKKIDVGPVKLDEEVDKLFDYYGGWAEECGIALERTGAAAIQGHQSMLRRAFGNLISNAIRHTPADGSVRVTISTENSGVTITVENPGQTIPPEHLSKLFDRFYRIDFSRQQGVDGAGLGLAIVKSIVTAHGGNVDVTSYNGLTRFQISLPLHQGPISTDNRLRRDK